MKKLFTLVLISVIALSTLIANPVSKEKAQQVAENYYMYYAPGHITDFTVANSFSSSHKGVTTYYTFVFKAGGFVMVSADDAAKPILGYSHESTIDPNNINPAAKEWFASYDKEIQYIVEQKADNSETVKEWNRILANEFPEKDKSVDPLVETTWGQSSGWDYYVPSGTPVGCVATAMAQVMKYWEHPTTGVGWHSYEHPTYGVQTAIFDTTTYGWDNMPNDSWSHPAAMLSYHCGVAVDMDYATSGSGAFTMDATYAMANYFKYDQSINNATRASMLDTEWEALITAELDAGRPILHSGSDPSAGGHAFICDGYNTSGLFHFNWGWQGSEDGYYELENLSTTYNGTFNQNRAIVYNIQPAEEGEEDFLWINQFPNFPATSTYPGYIDAPSHNVAWAIGRDGSGGGADYRVYAKTTDAGTTWETQELDYGIAFSMIDAIDENTAYIAAYGSGDGNKVIRTTDGGATWEDVLSGAGGSSFFNVVHFFNENDGFVQGDAEGGEYELYTTTDGGDNWTRVDGENIPDPEASSEYGIVGMYDAMGDNIWYTTNNGYIYKSTDKGNTWTKHQIKQTSGQTNIEVAFAADAMTGIAVAYDDSDEYRSYKTTDGGETWAEITATGNIYTDGISYIPGTEEAFVTVGADATNNFMGMSYSLDGGDTWTEYADYYQNYQVISVDMVSINKGYAGTFQGEFKTGMWIFGGLDLGYKATFNLTYQGDPVEGAKVNIAGMDLMSDAAGAAEGEMINGDYAYEVTMDGFDTITGTVSIADENVTVDLTMNMTGISDATATQNFNIYPNPTTGVIRIETEGRNNVVTLYNAVGKEIAKRVIDNETTMNLSDYSEGVYFVRVQGENGVSTQRVVLK